MIPAPATYAPVLTAIALGTPMPHAARRQLTSDFSLAKVTFVLTRKDSMPR